MLPRFHSSLLGGRERIGSLELLAQGGRSQAFTQVCELLLEARERNLDVTGVGNSDITPHRIGARCDAGHLAQGAASDGVDLGRVAELIEQRSSHCGGNELLQMTDPSANTIMLRGVEEQ